jgi:hypothetical protein
MGRQMQFRTPTTLNPFRRSIMHSFKTALFAALALAAGAAMADTSVVNMDNISQSQSGSRNKQSLELATVDGGAISGGTARTTATNITQSQGGNNNTQEMVLGKIDKDFGHHSTTVTANRVSQFQTGDHNTQRVKAGVIE